MISAPEALQKLKDGNRRFVAGESDHDAGSHRHRPDLVEQQSPFAIVLACSDSRAPIELLFDQGLGDLFVIRVAGNIVAPSQIGSVEYAADVLGSRLVVVLGHSNCGAVVATLQALRSETDVESPNLKAIVDRVRPAVKADDTLEEAIRANVQMSVDQLRTGSDIIAKLVENDGLQILGAEYSLATGEVTFLT